MEDRAFSLEPGYREHLSLEITRGLDERVKEFRCCKLKAEYPFLLIRLQAGLKWRDYDV